MKKAWELEYEVLKNSTPVILTEEEQNWKFADEIEKMEDILTSMKWFSNVPGSGAPERVILGAIEAVESMGYDVTEAEKLIPQGLEAYEKKDFKALNKLTCRIWYLLNNAPKDLSSAYWRYGLYEQYEDYAKTVQFPEKVSVDTTTKHFWDMTYLAWQAQIVGGAFGTALEGYTTDNLRKVFGDVRDYVRKPNTYNDDITYEIAFLQAYSEFGAQVTSADIAEEWVALVPFGWSAEEWALKNIKSGIYPPRSGIENNPYREWIGAQMRGGICGMVSPGNPEEAARLAFIDGQVSHYNNGVLGEVFNAIMMAFSYVEKDVRIIVLKSIKLIPKDAQYREVIEFALTQCQTHDDWEAAWRPCEERFKRYNWIHSYPNVAAEIIALWFGKGDFDETMYIIGMAGYDVDCNAAQIAPIVAVLNGQIPNRWIEPIGDNLDTYIRDMKKTSITAITNMAVDAMNKHRK